MKKSISLFIITLFFFSPSNKNRLYKRFNDLNEFEVAAFQDQANFIKIFTPTNDYVRTYTNDFNQGLFLNPETQWGTGTGVKKFLSRFSNRTNYRVARKVSDKTDYYNPFIGSVDDSSLVTLNLGFLNTIYFNRTNTNWSADFTYQDNQDKSLLTNGKESRRYFIRTLKIRWNLTRTLTFNTTLANGVKNNKSQFFTNQNYYLTNYEAEPKLVIQPNVKFRITILYKYKEKYNDEILGGQELKANKVGGEFRYNIASKGSFLFSINFIENKYKSIINNESLNYEMLEGLQQGSNTTWELVFQQNLSNDAGTVMPLESVGWFVGTQGGINSLFRVALIAGVAQIEEVVQNVNSLQLQYLVQGANNYVDANLVVDWGAVMSIRATLTLTDNPAMPLALGVRQISQVINLRNRKE